MAFVFQTERWKQVSPLNSIGPGHYNAQVPSKRIKCALITPQLPKSKEKTIFKTSPSHHDDQQSLLTIQQNQKNVSIKNSSPKKHLKRAATAKCTQPRKQTLQSPTIFKPRDMNLEVTNSNNSLKKSFENSVIRKSLRRSKKSIHSQIQKYGDKPFCDKSLRTFQTINQKNSAMDYFNTMFTRSSSNPHLTRFNSSKNKAQNVYLSSQPSFLKDKEPENFMIASGNCKKSTMKPSNVVSLKDSTINKLDGFEDMQTTGIEDSLDSSFEYLQDSTPGPGQYDLRKEKTFLKSKVQKFGVTQTRFRQPNHQQTILNLNIQLPSFKKSSKAPQFKVSFGKSRPQTAKQTTNQIIFYQDAQNIENKCIKNLIKDRQAPGTFMSKCDRFRKKKQQTYNGPDFFDKEYKQQKISLPNSIFMSQVERHQRPLSPTANVDFEGQNYKTIEQKLQKFVQSKYIVDTQIPGFNVSEPRFKYNVKQQADQPLKRPLTTGSEMKRKELKSYTFRKDGMGNHQQSVQNPAPWTYNLEMKWLKPSHHIRFKF